MPTFLYRCPATAQMVQGWNADDPREDRHDADAYEALECPACGGVHLVRPATGQVLGQPDERRLSPFCATCVDASHTIVSRHPSLSSAVKSRRMAASILSG